MPVDFPNIRHLKAFREVADRKGISAAAESVHLSQPAVTQAIAGLEKRLDLALFERRVEGMFVTEPGEVFLARVRRIFEHFSQGAALACKVAGRKDGKPVAGFHNRITASQLRALIAIWESGSFSMAARSIGISQPSIHRAGRDLEKISGMRFFAANRRGIELTPQAEAFAREVKLAAAELRQGYAEIAQMKGQDSSHIAVGSMPLSRSSILPEAIHGLMETGVAIQMRTVDGPYTELLRGLRHGDLDFLIGALRDPAPSEDVIQEPLFNDPLAIVVGASHPLAGRRDLTLDDTLGYPWIAPPATTPAGSYLQRVLDFSDRPQTPIRVVASSLVLVRGMLARGDYVTIMSRHQILLEHAQGLMVPLEVELPGSLRPIGLTFRAGWTPTPTQRKFLDLIRAAAGASYVQIE